MRQSSIPFQHFFQVVAPGDVLEPFPVERIQMDVDPPQSGVVELLGVLGQQDAVGGQGQVLDAGDRHQLANQLGEAFADQRLAAGDAQLADAHGDRNLNKMLDFLERQDVLAGLELDPFFGHAIETADVTAVGDADPQVVVQAAEAVDERGHAGPTTLL